MGILGSSLGISRTADEEDWPRELRIHWIRLAPVFVRARRQSLVVAEVSRHSPTRRSPV
jgi:hypothetical protein